MLPSEAEKRSIAQYVEAQARPESVKNVERVDIQRSAGRQYEIWDVTTDGARYWVITNLTNLYSQEKFPSRDYALSFHIGLMARLADRDRESRRDEDYFNRALARLRAAQDAFGPAQESPHFQSVGLHCRDALVEAAAGIQMFFDEHGSPAERPKGGDFKGWVTLVAEQFVKRRKRKYVVDVCSGVWDLAVWLQHNRRATHWDANLVLEATHHAVDVLWNELQYLEVPTPTRCPSCDSYKIVTDMERLETGDEFVMKNTDVCTSCGRTWPPTFSRWDEEGHCWINSDNLQFE